MQIICDYFRSLFQKPVYVATWSRTQRNCRNLNVLQAAAAYTNHSYWTKLNVELNAACRPMPSHSPLDKPSPVSCSCWRCWLKSYQRHSIRPYGQSWYQAKPLASGDARVYTCKRVHNTGFPNYTIINFIRTCDEITYCWNKSTYWWTKFDAQMKSY